MAKCYPMTLDSEVHRLGCYGTTSDILTECQALDLEEKVRSGTLPKVYEHLKSSQSTPEAARDFFEFFANHYKELFNPQEPKFDPDNYCINDDYETESSSPKVTIHRYEQENFSSHIQKKGPAIENCDVDLDATKNNNDTVVEAKRMDHEMPISSKQGQIVWPRAGYTQDLLKMQVQKLFQTCGLLEEMVHGEDVLFDLEVLNMALKALRDAELSARHERSREIIFLRNLVRHAREEWRECCDRANVVKKKLILAEEEKASLIMNRDDLEMQLANFHSNSAIVEAREKRCRKVLEDNLSLKQTVARYLCDVEKCGDMSRKARVYNYHLGQLESENRRLTEELKSALCDSEKWKCFSEAFETSQARIKKLEQLGCHKDLRIRRLETEVTEIASLQGELECLGKELVHVLDEKAKIDAAFRENKSKLDLLTAKKDLQQQDSNFLLQRLQMVDRQREDEREQLSFYRQGYNELMERERAYKRQIVAIQAEHQSSITECETMADTIRSYKEKLSTAKNEVEWIRKSKHDRIKEAFMGSGLFVRSRSAGVTVSSASSSPVASPPKIQFMNGVGSLMPGRSHSFTNLRAAI